MHYFTWKLEFASNILWVIVDPISKNIIRNENPLFKDISTFDALNPVIGSLLRKIDIGQKDVLSKILGKVPNPRDIKVRGRLDKLRNFNNNTDNNSSSNNNNNNNNIFHHHHLHYHHHSHHKHLDETIFFQPQAPFQPPLQTSRQNDFFQQTILPAPSAPLLAVDD